GTSLKASSPHCGSSPSGEPANRYRNAAIDWREIGAPGRKVPSVNPPVMPSSTIQAISPQNPCAFGTSGKASSLHCGSSPSGEPAYRYRKAAMPWREIGRVGLNVPSVYPPVTPEATSHSMCVQNWWLAATSGKGPVPGVSRHCVGVTGADGADAGLSPTALVATTVKVCAAPLVSPVTTHEVVVDVHCSPPGEAVTVYPVIGEPPLSAGTVHETVASPAPATATTL